MRTHAHVLRQGAGVVVGLTAVAIAMNVPERLATAVPGYTQSFQERIERSSSARHELARLSGADASAAPGEASVGTAPEIQGIDTWINTPDGKSLTLAGLRGRVVLLDFWTYSCINCLRTLPHLEAWDRAYRAAGLTIVGVHSPEFAFERVPDNVRAAVKRLDVRYPVALDNDFATWRAYSNQYWPAEYLIDRNGRLRFHHFGEGSYEDTEGGSERCWARQVKTTGPTSVEGRARRRSSRRRSPTSATSGSHGSRTAGSRPTWSGSTRSRTARCRTTRSRMPGAGRSSASASSPRAARG